MEHGASTRRRNRRRVAVVTLLSVVVVLAASGPYLLFDPSTAENTVGLRPDVPIHFPFLAAHALTAGIALLVGPWQFVRRVRRRRRLHRYLGRVYLFAGVVPASITGLVAAVLTTAGPVAGLGFVLLDVAWVATAAAGYLAAREGRYGDHRRWMIRNFALTFAGVMLRLWVPLLVTLQLSFDQAYALVPWLSWIPNLAVVELSLRRPGSVRIRETSSVRSEPAGKGRLSSSSPAESCADLPELSCGLLLVASPRRALRPGLGEVPPGHRCELGS